RRGYTLAVLEITDAPTATTAVEARHFPLCLVVGNELHGVREALVEAADLALEIPQYGAKHSLNVAVAFGVAVFDLVRCYRTHAKGA
ncbi:MAG: TrmH family RNA methyltransferase, partial [Rhodothermales bacterium]|nr:TrmH family RNA methyltransferase [Rhodothermales bacterium]